MQVAPLKWLYISPIFQELAATAYPDFIASYYVCVIALVGHCLATKFLQANCWLPEGVGDHRVG